MVRLLPVPDVRLSERPVRRTLVRTAGPTAPLAAAGGSTANTLSASELVPADKPVIRIELDSEWKKQVWSRVAEYSELTRGWDSYGAEPLAARAVYTLAETLMQFEDSVNESPRISMQVDGGLVCEWASGSAAAGTSLLSLWFSPGGDVDVEYESELSGSSGIRPINEAPDLNKWIWDASLNS